jgi:hypothetical protein
MITPTPKPPQDSPVYWRRRAAEARRAAEQMVDMISKKTLLDIAEAYEKLANFAETSAAKTDAGQPPDPDRT